MAFAQTQLRKLKSRLRPQHVRMRETEGQTLHYLEGWHVLAEANRIFGFDGWDRETVASTCVWTKQVGARYCAAYVARVRITVRAGEDRIIREGSGAGESNASSPGQAHERASKAAETDATKRALTTFGNCFGLSLYAGIALPEQASQRLDRPRAPQPVEAPVEMAQAKKQQNESEPTRHQQNDFAEVASKEVQESGAAREAVAASPQHASSFSEDQQRDEDIVMRASESSGLSDSALPNFSANADTVRSDRSPQKIDKSVLAIPEPRRVRDAHHLRFVAAQPCLICDRRPSEAHHVRFAQPRALGRKVSDAYTVPLCALHHRELHARGNEVAWWSDKGRTPLPIANQLWTQSRRKSPGEDLDNDDLAADPAPLLGRVDT